MIDGFDKVSDTFGKEEFLAIPKLPIELKFPDFGVEGGKEKKATLRV